jgi:hypothetical protein
MRTTRWIALVLLLLAVGAASTVSTASGIASRIQQEGPGRGDDLGRIKAWRTFLDRADRAFFAARMNTEAVGAKTAEADERIEELEVAARSSEPDPGGRSDITGDVAFLERALRAFTAAHMNTADVQKWLKEAREKS